MYTKGLPDWRLVLWMVENRVWEDLKNPEEEPKEQTKQQTYPFWHQSREYKPCLTGGGGGGGGGGASPQSDPFFHRCWRDMFPFHLCELWLRTCRLLSILPAACQTCLYQLTWINFVTSTWIDTGVWRRRREVLHADPAWFHEEN